jgi:acyl-CoA thioester hydrolase
VKISLPAWLRQAGAEQGEFIPHEETVMNGVYEYDFRVPVDAADPNGHVSNIDYVRWMIEAAHRHSASTGCTAATRESGATWVVRSHWIEYLRPAFAGEGVRAMTGVADLRRVQSRRKYRFLRQADRSVLAQGETEWVFVDAATGRPRAIPQAIKAVFRVVPDGPGARTSR